MTKSLEQRASEYRQLSAEVSNHEKEAEKKQHQLSQLRFLYREKEGLQVVLSESFDTLSIYKKGGGIDKVPISVLIKVMKELNVR